MSQSAIPPGQGQQGQRQPPQHPQPPQLWYPGPPGRPWQGPPPPGYRPVFPVLEPQRAVPSPRTRITIIVLLCAAALALVYSMLTPLIYPENQPWGGGLYLWQWTPHLLGEQSDVGTGMWVTFFLTTITTTLLVLLAAAGVLGRLPTVVLGIAAGCNLVVSALMGLMVLIAMGQPEIAAGPAVVLNLVGGTLALVIPLVPSWRRVWMRPAML